MTSNIVISPGGFSSHSIVAASLLTLIPDHKNARIVQTRSEQVRSEAVAEIGLPGVYDINRLRFCLPGTHKLPIEHFHDKSNEKTNNEPKSDAKRAKSDVQLPKSDVELPESADAPQKSVVEPQTRETDQISKDIPLALVGSVWKHFGEQILRQTFEISEDSHVKRIWHFMYDRHFRALDASFHGIHMCACTHRKFYSALSFANLISTMDPRWEQEGDDSNRQERLNECVRFAREIIADKIRTLIAEDLPTLETVSSAFAKRLEAHPSKRIVFLEHFVPWGNVLYELEEKENLSEDEVVQWVCFQDYRTLEWRATAPASLVNRFDNRALVHESLRGLRNEELAEKLQIETPAFVHHSGFTCGAKTKESVLKLIEFSK